MARNKTAALRVNTGLGSWYDLFSSRECGVDASDMTKKYEVTRERVPVPGGGFADALRLAIVEVSCLGESRLCISGYPHESEDHAFASDWDRLAQDANTAAEKLKQEIVRQKAEKGIQREGVDAGSTTGAPKRDAFGE